MIQKSLVLENLPTNADILWNLFTFTYFVIVYIIRDIKVSTVAENLWQFYSAKMWQTQSHSDEVSYVASRMLHPKHADWELLVHLKMMCELIMESFYWKILDFFFKDILSSNYTMKYITKLDKHETMNKEMLLVKFVWIVGSTALVSSLVMTSEQSGTIWGHFGRIKFKTEFIGKRSRQEQKPTHAFH